MKENYHFSRLKSNLWCKYKRLAWRPQISVSVYHKASVVFHGPHLTHKQTSALYSTALPQS